MSAFREYWMVVKDNEPGCGQYISLSSGQFERHFNEDDARKAAVRLAKTYKGNTYVVLKATAACVTADMQWLNPAPF